MLSLKGDLEDRSNTESFEGIIVARNKQDNAREQHLPGLSATKIVRWRRKFIHHYKQQRRCKKNCLPFRSEDTIEISSSSFVFKQLKIYYYKLFG